MTRADLLDRAQGSGVRKPVATKMATKTPIGLTFQGLKSRRAVSKPGIPKTTKAAAVSHATSKRVLPIALMNKKMI